ncbi:MAG: hypothetical protein ISR65_09505 [Bacteriovoracaceae bacterium]|nr:hypothetical protein [Bacteriovoracaceae bacterium]
MTDINFLIQFFILLFWVIGFFIAPLDGKTIKMYSMVGASIFLVFSLRLAMMVKNLNLVSVLAKVSVSEQYGLNLLLGLDGLSYVFVVLNALMLLIATFTCWNLELKRYKIFFTSLFTLAWSLNAALLSLNVLPFYVFGEMAILPTFILVSLFRSNDATEDNFFFIVISVSSGVILSVLMYLCANAYELYGNYDLTLAVIKDLKLKYNGIFSPAFLVFTLLSIASMAKMSIFPFHNIRNKIFINVPLPAILLIDGIFLKMAAYGLLRFIIPGFREVVTDVGFYFVCIGIFSILFTSILVMSETKILKIISFSSATHLGIVAVGLFAMNDISVVGSIIHLMSSVLLITGALMIVKLFHKNFAKHTNDRSRLLTLSMLIILILGPPITVGFIGSFMTVVGIVNYSGLIGLIFSISLLIFGFNCIRSILRSSFTNYLYMTVTNEGQIASIFEQVSFVCIFVLVVLIGVFPTPIIELIKWPIKYLVSVL